jgi:dipeptidyl aminopeptidase/acylaminoacyl peptidase
MRLARNAVNPLIYQGSADPVVPQSQSEGMVASLKARGIRHDYVVYDGEGHGWRKSDTIAHYYGSVYQFLLKNVIYI